MGIGVCFYYDTSRKICITPSLGERQNFFEMLPGTLPPPMRYHIPVYYVLYTLEYARRPCTVYYIAGVHWTHLL